jgi:hypothetical protein
MVLGFGEHTPSIAQFITQSSFYALTHLNNYIFQQPRILLRRRSHVRTRSIDAVNRAGQAKTVKYVSGIKCRVVQKTLLI